MRSDAVVAIESHNLKVAGANPASATKNKNNKLMATNKVKTEKDWMAEDDARTMAQYEEIMADSQRKARAVKAAKDMASDLNKRANAMNKVAGKSTTSKSKKK